LIRENPDLRHKVFVVCPSPSLFDGLYNSAAFAPHSRSILPEQKLCPKENAGSLAKNDAGDLKNREAGQYIIVMLRATGDARAQGILSV